MKACAAVRLGFFDLYLSLKHGLGLVIYLKRRFGFLMLLAFLAELIFGIVKFNLHLTSLNGDFQNESFRRDTAWLFLFISFAQTGFGTCYLFEKGVRVLNAIRVSSRIDVRDCQIRASFDIP